jgi:hypothetical protein
MKTEYNLKGEVMADQLFSDAQKPDNGTENADAAMVNQQP